MLQTINKNCVQQCTCDVPDLETLFVLLSSFCASEKNNRD